MPELRNLGVAGRELGPRLDAIGLNPGYASRLLDTVEALCVAYTRALVAAIR